MRFTGVFILFCVLFISCSKDDADYGLGVYEEQLADVRIIDSKPAFLLDNGDLLYDTGTKTPNDLKENQRVRINYTILSTSTQGFVQTIRVNWLNKISYRNLQATDFKTISSIANDPIFFESAWIGSNYLNMIFSFDYKSQAHKIYLVTDSSKLKNDSIYIYFRHDTNNDEPGYRNRIISSFDLKPVLGDPKGNKRLFVNFNTNNYGNTTYEYKY